MQRSLCSLIVGVIVMLAIPVSQLRLVTIRIECCCPDPEQCKCPDHDKEKPGQTTIQACHKTSNAMTSAATSTFDVPAPIAIMKPATRVVIDDVVFAEPPEPPAPPRPPRPS